MKLSALSFIAFGVLSLSASAQTGDDVIKKHIEAIGGEKNWSKINSIKTTGNLSMMGMEVPTTRVTVQNKGLRMDFTIMGSENYVIMTPRGGWQYMPVQGMDKPQAMPEDQVKLGLSKLDFRSIAIADKSLITKAEYAGIDTIETVACHKVTITAKDGNKQTSYFDTKDYYLLRTEIKIKAEDGQEQEVGFNFGNYQKQPEGIVLAMSESAPAGAGDFVWKKVEINKPVPDDAFKPAETKK